MIPTMVSDTRVEGAIQNQEAGLLYLAIPYDEGWTLTVDGRQTRITPVGDAMIAVHLEAGLHTIALDYEAPGFALGLKISLICLAAFLALVIASLLIRFSRPPIVKVPVSLADPRVGSTAPTAETPPAAEPLPPREPGASMPKLDLTQTWDPTGDAPLPQTPDAASAAQGKEPLPAEETAQSSGRLLSTTGMFDPNTISRAEEEGRGAAFDILEHLEELERLLDETDESFPQKPNQ